MDDRAQKLLVVGFVVLAAVVVFGLLFLVKRGPAALASRLGAELLEVNRALAFAPWQHSFRTQWLAPEQTTTALYTQIGGRPVLVHYCAYTPGSVARVLVGLPRGPVRETWIEAAIRPTLALGADEPSDPLAIRRGLGPGEPGTGLVIRGQTQTLLVNRRAATHRLMSLLDHPRVGATRAELGPHMLGGSDDTLLVALDGLADAARIRRACDVACAIAAMLPELRRELPATELDGAVRRLAQQCERGLAGTNVSYDAGACSGSFVTLEMYGKEALEGIGMFAKSGSGFQHLVGHRSARIPPRFDTHAVHAALQDLGRVPELVSIDVKGSRLRFVAAPAADHTMLISAAVGLARAVGGVRAITDAARGSSR